MSKVYVYKITNKINNKCYIGITNNIKKRWSNEKSYPTNPKRRQVIQEAIHKYGKENFLFEILFQGISIEEACELEEKLALQYNSYYPNGYNIAKCGEYFPDNFSNQPHFRENNPNAKITTEEAQYILDNRDKPMYVLYEEFNEKITYPYFKKIYKHECYTYLQTDTVPYKYNLEFSLQYASGKLDYGDIISLRVRHSNGEYWEDAYKDYEGLFPNKWDFWNIYYGNRYKLTMPEVFSEENRKYHSSLGKTGDKNSRAKLANSDAMKIRELWASGIPRYKLYEMFPQVSPTSIRNVINNKTFKNVL